ncbi:leucine-rich repeat protein [Treponema sp. OMZ 906]|uniref:leucine-rich repeat protein n=1 Tax=Treponema sp. OMZ 906 TaxID=2563662 RepID=UPI0020A4813E|nr:leucine-rich repeat protein [Treponema sp. OMZ 906]UTC54728.1 leucine-rich repeat protein [Treponema sp. OMZ 906]
MRKFYIILTGILFTLLFATCTQFTADIDDYLSRWSSEAFIQSSSIDKKTYNDANGMASVASADKVTITLKVQNPKSFRFVMPSASETRKIVEFAHFAGTKPAAGTDYELIQPSADTLKLVYKDSFLKKAEWGEKDISSTITLYANDGRPPFKQTFTIPLKANTPPPKPGYAVAKTTGTTAYYVLCITVPDMDKTAGGGLLHKDLACIEVNGTPYTFSVNEAQTAFTKPEDPVFITHSDVEKLSNQPNDAIPTDSSWVLYYQTDVKVELGAAKKDYTIKLIDKKGLASDIVNASTKPNKPETEIVRITKGEKIPGSGSGSSDTDPIIIGTDGDKAEIRIASATANTTVHCTRTDTGTSIPYDGNPVTVPLPLNGGNEKQYKLEYYTDGTGFAATPVKTIYYKVVKAHTVTYRVEIVDEVAGGTIETGSSGQKTSGTVSVAHGNSVTFTGQPTTGDWKVAGWTVSPGSFASPPGTSTTATLSNVTAATTVTVKFYQSTLQNSATWKDLARAVKNAPDNAVIFIDGEIKATSGTGNNGEIVINKNLTIKRATGASSAVIDANKDTGSKPKHRIFKVKSGNTLTLENLTLKGGIAEMSDMDGGGGVYVETSGKLIMTGSSITDCEAIGDTGANKYGEGGGVYNKGTVKMTGGEIRNNKARNGGGIDNNGTLILTNATLTGNTATFIGGALCMSDGSSNEMTGGKIISNTCSGSGDGGGVYIHAGTFTLKSGASIESNTADYGGGAYVGQNGTLIINGGSIKLNKAQSRGGGVYVSGNSAKRGTLRMIQGDISDNGAGWNGTSYTGTGGGVYNNGVFEMTGGEIKDNKAQTGGGVYFSEGTFKMSGSAVVTPATGSEANDKGKNDVYLESGKTITVDGTLTGTAPVARITPELYTEQVVLKAASGSGVTLADEVGKFTVTSDVKDDGIAQAWIIDTTGKLEKSNMEVRYDKLASYLSPSPHAVEEGGVYRFKITGTIPSNHLQSAGYNQMGRLAQTIHNSNKKVALILPDSIPDLTSMNEGFYGCEYLVSLENIPSGVTDMEGCFKGCTKLTHAPAIPSGVTTMRECFKGCTDLRRASNIPSTVGNMNKCFEDCKNLTVAPQIESGVTNMERSFAGCKALTQGPDIPSSVSMMYQCFDGCKSLKGVKLMCNYDDSVSLFQDVFKNCTALEDGGIKVPSGSLTDYQNHAGKMGTTAGKFSGS